MSGTVWTRWYFSDWMSDPNVRACSLAARGLWMDMLCIASANQGFVSVAGRGLGAKEIARHVGEPEELVLVLLQELETNEVFSRDKRGVIYCRRMVRAEKYRKNGQLGGNPKLRIKKESAEINLGKDQFPEIEKSMKNKANKKAVGLKPKALIPETRVQEERKEPFSLIEPDSNTDLFPISQLRTDESARDSEWPSDYREQFWKSYPRRVGKTKALAKLDAIRKSGKVPWPTLVNGIKHYLDYIAMERKETQFIKHPTTWLNGGCWHDEHPTRPTAQTGSAAILAGVASAAEQRARDRGAA